jgi:hypothetical protein
VADPYPAKPQAALSLLGAIIVRNRALFCQNICFSAHAADQFSWLESYTVTANSLPYSTERAGNRHIYMYIRMLSHFPTAAATTNVLRLHIKWRDMGSSSYILKWLDADYDGITTYVGLRPGMDESATHLSAGF